jgi:nucleotide-binding universal stress UspA family protein
MPKYSEFNLKTIMVATDLSPASQGALGYAWELARRFSAKILLTHIIDHALLTTTQKCNLCDTVDCAEKQLQTTLGALQQDDIECRVVVREGNIHDTILHLVEERKVDLLVLGTKGQAPKSGDGLGSVAEMLLRAMPCPVLTVGPNRRWDAFDGAHSGKIMVTTDFAEASTVALEYAECLAARFDGDLYLLHVEDKTSNSHAMSLAEQKDQFQEFAKGMKDASRIAEYITSIGAPAERIVKAAEEKDADLLVMRVHESDQPGGGRVHGVAYDVIRQVRCPVFTLFVPTEEEKARAAQ